MRLVRMCPPVCCCRAGLDSSTVAALACVLRLNQSKTFSISFAESY